MVTNSSESFGVADDSALCADLRSVPRNPLLDSQRTTPNLGIRENHRTDRRRGDSLIVPDQLSGWRGILMEWEIPIEDFNFDD